MIENPARHFLNRRFEDVAELGRTPESLRPQTFPERYLRPTTDHALAAASINWSDEAMASKTRNQRKRLDALRVAHSHQWEATTPRSIFIGAAAAGAPGRARLSRQAQETEKGETNEQRGCEKA